jgi:aromatic ring hydroxylase|tara:strand:- start:76 stop:264 length:189 start_codon:yes stop_codon:yes gene_type:complete
MSKKFTYDGKSRPTNDVYSKRWDEIFGKDKEKFNRLQQEQRDLDASYQQSKLNKKERDDKKK